MMQNPSAVVMVRPAFFGVNHETAADNAFQTRGAEGDRGRAVAEFDAMVRLLREAGVVVHVFDQLREDTPDAVFPNNWFSTHATGEVVRYPMMAPSRRLERRSDIIDALWERYGFKQDIDLTTEEKVGRFLEGTGAIVFDHAARTAFMARSQRADETLLGELCTRLGFRPHVFTATGPGGQPIYHTNVMLSVGMEVVLVGLQTIPNRDERRQLHEALAREGRLLVELSADQISEFAGNALEVEAAEGRVLVLSSRAWRSLTTEQKGAVEERVGVITPDLPTIEKSGGSARCMMAGVHAPPT